MGTKKIVYSLISLAFSILLLASSVFAWYTLRSTSSVDEIVINVDNLKVDIVLEAKKNNGEFIKIVEVEEFENLFRNCVPSDSFLFKLSITNKSTRVTKLKVLLNDIYSVNPNEGFDMRNVFYIEDGLVKVNNIETYLKFKNENIEPVHNQELNLYNINNLTSNNSIILLEGYNFNANQTVEIEFKIVYDENTSKIEYQDGKLSISSINIYNN